jgi:hypothetical protein
MNSSLLVEGGQIQGSISRRPVVRQKNLNNNSYIAHKSNRLLKEASEKLLSMSLADAQNLVDDAAATAQNVQTRFADTDETDANISPRLKYRSDSHRRNYPSPTRRQI